MTRRRQRWARRFGRWPGKPFHRAPSNVRLIRG